MSEKEFSYGEKLALVSKGLMDPKEIGVVSEEEAKIKLVDGMTPEQILVQAKFGDFFVMEMSEVPIILRAQWALKDLKVAIPESEKPDYIENWVSLHKKEHLIQARFNSGKIAAGMELLVSDTVLGFAELLKKTAIAVEKRYEEQLQLEKKITEDSNKGEQPNPEQTQG